MSTIQFRPVVQSDYPLLHRWFNTPHVQEFYSLGEWSTRAICNKFSRHVDGASDVDGFIIEYDNVSIGFIQHYPYKNYTLSELAIPANIINEMAGVDLFIGQPEFLGKGLGTQVVHAFLSQKIWPSYAHCLADPDLRNERAIKLFKRCGFAKQCIVQSRDDVGRPTQLQIMIAHKNN